MPPFERGPAARHADEAGVIARCVAGERKAYGILVDRYKQVVHDLVYRMVGDAQQAEDIAQDAFVKAFVSIRCSASYSLGPKTSTTGARC